MKPAFIDTSALLSVLFDEPGSGEIRRILGSFSRLYASNLLEAEVRSAAAREDLNDRDVEAALSRVEWVLPDRPLSQELRAAAASGVTLKGADLWHVAAALYLAGDPSQLPFLTMDRNQARAARKLGFRVLPAEGMGYLEAREPSAKYRAKRHRTSR